MSKQYLWITKNANSKKLSQSSRSEESRIRQHVQLNRVEDLERKEFFNHLQIQLPLNSSVVCLTLQEKRSLSFFFEHTAPEWSGWQDSDFWNGLVFQASRQDQAVAHALVAIAARHEYSWTPANTPLAHQLSHLAVFEYSKALALLRATDQLTYSRSLISCVILASVQSHTGNYQSYRLLRSGIALHEESQKLRLSSNSPSYAVAQHTISQETSTLISRLQERLCMMGDQPGAFARSVQHRWSQQLPRRTLPLIPTSFHSLRHARDCLESILNWGHDNVIDYQYGSATWSCFCHLLEEHIDQWEGALYTSKFTNTPNHCLHLLQIAALNGMILISSYPAQKETTYDIYTSQFLRIMDLVAMIPLSNVHRARVSFGIDCGLIDIVAFVGSRCREPWIRRAALHWLQDCPRFEGERLSSVAAQIIKAWIGLEEQEDTQSSTHIPESSRRKLLAGERYHDQHLIKLIFAFSPYDLISNSQTDVVWIRSDMETDLTESGVCASNEELPESMPDVIFSPGHAAFLDHEEGMYHHFYSTQFRFPIPRR